MKTAGIICEYNPFHNGHLYHIQKTREAGATHIICVMSGNFVQRGDISIVPKSAKVQMAIDGGADLVLELPTIWSLSPAEFFAKGAVSILKNSGVCDMLSFGSESGDLEALENALRAVKDERVQSFIGNYLNEGLSFVSARSKAVSTLYGAEIENTISSPNDILALEYLNAIGDTAFSPLAITRSVAHDENSFDAFLKSASEIRKMILSSDIGFKKAVPQSSFDILREYAQIGQFPLKMEDLDKAIMAVLRRFDAEDFTGYSDVSEGLENRLYTAVMQSKTVHEILMRAKSKRYTLARLRRILLCAYLNIGKGYQNAEVPYIRVLGMNERGKEILREMKQKATKPVILRYSDFQSADGFARKVFATESRASDLYSLAFKEPSPCGTEMTNTLYIKE